MAYSFTPQFMELHNYITYSWAADAKLYPIRNSIFSNPVEIRSVRIMNIENEDEIEQKGKSHQIELQSDLI